MKFYFQFRYYIVESEQTKKSTLNFELKKFPPLFSKHAALYYYNIEK